VERAHIELSLKRPVRNTDWTCAAIFFARRFGGLPVTCVAEGNPLIYVEQLGHVLGIHGTATTIKDNSRAVYLRELSKSSRLLILHTVMGRRWLII